MSRERAGCAAWLTVCVVFALVMLHHIRAHPGGCHFICWAAR